MISNVLSFYRKSQVIERFRSRISFRDELNSLNNFKRLVDSFLGVKEKARELGITWFELKLSRLVRAATGAGDCENYAIYPPEQWDMERPLLLGSSFRTGSELKGKLTMFFSLKMDH